MYIDLAGGKETVATELAKFVPYLYFSRGNIGNSSGSAIGGTVLP